MGKAAIPLMMIGGTGGAIASGMLGDGSQASALKGLLGGAGLGAGLSGLLGAGGATAGATDALGLLPNYAAIGNTIPAVGLPAGTTWAEAIAPMTQSGGLLGNGALAPAIGTPNYDKIMQIGRLLGGLNNTQPQQPAIPPMSSAPRPRASQIPIANPGQQVGRDLQDMVQLALARQRSLRGGA